LGFPAHHIWLGPAVRYTGVLMIRALKPATAERKSFSKLEKALLRKVEFGSKVDNSILQLC